MKTIPKKLRCHFFPFLLSWCQIVRCQIVPPPIFELKMTPPPSSVLVASPVPKWATDKASQSPDKKGNIPHSLCYPMQNGQLGNLNPHLAFHWVLIFQTEYLDILGRISFTFHVYLLGTSWTAAMAAQKSFLIPWSKYSALFYEILQYTKWKESEQSSGEVGNALWGLRGKVWVVNQAWNWYGCTFDLTW